MTTPNRYVLEHALVVATLLVGVAGFWKLYVGPNAAPNGFHHLHVVANFAWLLLLLWQLRLVATRQFANHRKAGLCVLVAGPLLFASAALLSVHSAHKGVVSGEGDFLIVQNVMGTLQIGLMIGLAFVLRRRRALHGAFLLSTANSFMGVALFFTLISFVPALQLGGPDTFERLAIVGATGQGICLAIGLLFVIKDWRNGWPVLLAALYFPLNDGIRALLASRDLIDPLTEFVGALDPAATFAGSLLAYLAALGAFVGVPAMQSRTVVRQRA
ncbi:hypothetical protein [Cognatilysobacter tabacisoli]|uniref:hypothetical protein n=1 Tax=Cognatilysobacter tabacisoli TaxID=2315424 RepID=UPI000E6AFC6D|nr:hypothetical protein [Lysobacter tabacisoli]